MIKFIKELSKTLALMFVGVIIAVYHIEIKEKSIKQGKFTHQQVEDINPDAILGMATLSHPTITQAFIKKVLKNLKDSGHIDFHPMFGVVGLKKGSIDIIIDSNGGRVDLGMGISSLLQELRDNDIDVNCYVANATSMAFYVMVTNCDKVIATKNVFLMQHRVRYSSGEGDAATLETDNLMSKNEAEALGVDYKEWRALVRGEEDYVFDLQDIIKYKLVDEWL